MKKSNKITYLVLTIISIIILMGLMAMTINNYVVNSEKEKIISSSNENKITITKNDEKRLKKLEAQCIMVLGAGIKSRDIPSDILRDRLDMAIYLYKNGYAPKILLSGDNGQYTHNEIHTMLTYVKKHGVKEEDIFCDHAGFNTSASISRAKKIFQVNKMIIITQKYHQYRALYLAENKGIKALGVDTIVDSTPGQYKREIREILARNKDFFKVLAKEDNSLGGNTYPITGNGKLTYGE